MVQEISSSVRQSNGLGNKHAQQKQISHSYPSSQDDLCLYYQRQKKLDVSPKG